MLAKKYRLNVQTVLRSRGSLVRGRYLALKLLEAHHTFSRVAVVVGSRVDARATRRNALKRSLYGAATAFIKSSHSPVDIVITVSPTAGAVPASEVAAELTKLLGTI